MERFLCERSNKGDVPISVRGNACALHRDAGEPEMFLVLRQEHGSGIAIPFATGSLADRHGIGPGDDIEPVLRLCHQDDVPSLLAVLDASSKSGQACRCSVRIDERRLEFHAWPRVQAEQCVEWQAVLLQRTGTPISPCDTELLAILENSADIITRYDLDCRILYFSKQLVKLSGKPAAEIIGKTPSERYPDGSFDEFEAKLREVISRGIPDQYLLILTDAEGIRRHHHVEMTPARDGCGSINGVVAIGRDVTEIKQMEMRLRASEQDFHSLANNLPAAVLRYDAQGKRRYANPAAAMALRATVGELMTGQQDISQVATTPTQARFRRVIEEVIATGKPQEHEFISDALPLAQQQHYLVRFVPETCPDGQKGVLAIGFDIRAHREVERSRDELRQRQASVLQTIPDMVWLKDREGTYLACNHAFERLIGRREADMIGMTDYDLFDYELAEFFREKDHAAIEAGEITINEEWVTYPDTGERALLETRKVPVLDKTEKLVGVLGVARDITEHKRVLSELAASERQFRTLVENSSDPIVRYGPDFRRLYVSPVFASLVEGGEAALIGKTPSEWPGGEKQRFFEQKLQEVFAKGEVMEFEFEDENKDGVSMCCLVKLVPEFGEQGEIESVLMVARDITESYAFRMKIHQMAFFDTLTNLPNRALFGDRLQQMITDAKWHGQRAGVMMIDMDRFKAVNDTMGHAVGDELLREAAVRLGRSVRAYDTVARLGGDEFAILLPEVRSADDLGRIADKILERFDRPFLLDGKDVYVSCSIGISVFPQDSEEAGDLLKFADSAMYFAKRSGRNNFRFYAKELTASAQERLTLESKLRHAVEREEFELYYQPKVSLETGEIVGSEALLRWIHPKLGMMPPNRFIPVAEDTGLIVDIGAWVLKEACRTAAKWNGPGKPLHKVAINLSSRQFQAHSYNLKIAVFDALVETACKPEWIELELTESLLLDEDGKTLDILSAFRDAGISIAIDDFGTGYSALSYLTRFPIDTLKIDRSFIHSVTADNYRAELVKAVLSIARCLNQQVVAEGVETAEQMDFLRANGCELAQGFLFSRPLPQKEIEALPRHCAVGRVNGPSNGSQP